MSLLVRKIDKGKWLQNDIINNADVSADAVTICMKTKANKLSVWGIPTEDKLDDAALAIVTGGQHLETFDIVIMEKTYLSGNGIAYVQEDGRTPVEDLKKTHYDLVDLTYPRLGIIANHTVARFKLNKVIRYTELKLRKIINDAIKIKRLDPSRLEASIVNKL